MMARDNKNKFSFFIYQNHRVGFGKTHPQWGHVSRGFWTPSSPIPPTCNALFSPTRKNNAFFLGLWKRFEGQQDYLTMGSRISDGNSFE